MPRLPWYWQAWNVFAMAVHISLAYVLPLLCILLIIVTLLLKK